MTEQDILSTIKKYTKYTYVLVMIPAFILLVFDYALVEYVFTKHPLSSHSIEIICVAFAIFIAVEIAVNIFKKVLIDLFVKHEE